MAYVHEFMKIYIKCNSEMGQIIKNDIPLVEFGILLENQIFFFILSNQFLMIETHF